MYRRFLIIPIAVAVTFPGIRRENTFAGPPPMESRRDVVVLRHCDIDYEKSTVLSGHSGTGMALPLQDCLVELGDRVKAGQVLGRLLDRDLRIMGSLRRSEAESDIEIRLAESKRNELASKLRRTEKLRGNLQPYASEEEYDSARILVETAQLMIDDAKYKRKFAQIQCQEIDAQIKIREIIAPHNGLIVEVYKKPGETVIAGQPVFHLVEADRLRVTAYANLSDYNRIQPGQRIEIALENDALDPNILRRSFGGKVIFVDKRIDHKSQTCRIVAQVENQDLTLAAGLEARMTIYTVPSTAASPPRIAPVAQPAVPRSVSAIVPRNALKLGDR